MRKRTSITCWLICVILCPGILPGQEFDEQFDHWPVDHRIAGKIIFGTTPTDPQILARALRSHERQGPVAVLLNEDSDVALVDRFTHLFARPEPAPAADDSAADAPPTQKPANDKPANDKPANDKPANDKPANDKPASDKPATEKPKPEVPQPGNQPDKDRPQTPEPQPKLVFETTDQLSAEILQRLLADVSVFCWHDVSQDQAAKILADAGLHEALQDFVAAGHTLVMTGAGSACLAEHCWKNADHKAQTTKGLDLIPDCLVDTKFSDSPQSRGRILSLLARNPRCVGIGIEPDTLLVLDGRKIAAIGSGKATFMLMANERQPLRIKSIGQRQPGQRSANEFLVDLTEWRRDAIDRTLEPFPPAQPRKPFVKHGTLVIVGGGGMPDGLMEHIVELAGGIDEARMVYIPCSENEDVGETQRTVESWKRMGVKHATFIHTKDRMQANSDEEFLAPLKDATGLWFGGGRQWNFADSYYGTKAHKLMKDVLKRGGVIGGSSAGASIQARYLARATPIENFRIMAPGYERGGLGFISGVAIDQHFSQRGRQRDMTRLMQHHPQLLGIGIDEATAIIVRKSVAEVIGRGKVHFYDRQRPVFPDQPDYIALPAGSIFDLAEREVLKDTTPPETEPEPVEGDAEASEKTPANSKEKETKEPEPTPRGPNGE